VKFDEGRLYENILRNTKSG